MKSKLLLALISLLVMVFGLNYGWTDRVDNLINQLKDKEPNVRRHAAIELGKIRDARAVEPLIAALTDNDIDVRSYVAKALGKIGDKWGVNAAVETMLRDLKRKDKYIVWTTAANTLWKIGDKRGVDALMETATQYLKEWKAEVSGRTGDHQADKVRFGYAYDEGRFSLEVLPNPKEDTAWSSMEILLDALYYQQPNKNKEDKEVSIREISQKKLIENPLSDLIRDRIGDQFEIFLPSRQTVVQAQIKGFFFYKEEYHYFLHSLLLSEAYVSKEKGNNPPSTDPTIGLTVYNNNTLSTILAVKGKGKSIRVYPFSKINLTEPLKEEILKILKQQLEEYLMQPEKRQELKEYIVDDKIDLEKKNVAGKLLPTSEDLGRAIKVYEIKIKGGYNKYLVLADWNSPYLGGDGNFSFYFLLWKEGNNPQIELITKIDYNYGGGSTNDLLGVLDINGDDIPEFYFDHLIEETNGQRLVAKWKNGKEGWEEVATSTYSGPGGRGSVLY